MGDIENQIENARISLLDLTMRNRLLNFRTTKRRTLRIIDEIPREIYDILVIKERAMEFLPLTKDKISDEDIIDSSGDFSAPNSTPSNSSNKLDSSVWEIPPADEDLSKEHIDKYLQTNTDSETLQRHLFYIYHESNSVLEEQGYTVLYLALGFLEWKESPSSDDFKRAPLILIPVELERQSVRSRFRLKWTGEDIIANISLQEKLREQAVDIPDFDMPEKKEGVVSYFSEVRNSISKKQDWKILDHIYLGFFSFTKFVMWKDLDLKSWSENVSLKDYPLIEALFDPSMNFNSSIDDFSEKDIDTKLISSFSFNVVDADPSQIKVIENVKRGQNLVVEGPPGTGKSQTITNIIAELLVMGKSVLFISEKMAALEVVKSRLDKIGLGEFCLELHSRKSNKKEVIKEIERTMSAPIQIDEKDEYKYQQLDKLKRELNDFAKALREKVGSSSLSVYQLYDIAEKANKHFENSTNIIPNVKLPDPSLISQNQINQALDGIREVRDIIPLVEPFTSNPWIGCSPDSITKSDEEEVRTLISRILDNIAKLNSDLNNLSQLCGTNIPTSLGTINKVLEAARIIAISKPIDQEVLLNSEWNEPSNEISNIITLLESFQKDYDMILELFTPDSLELNIEDILNQYNIESKKFLKFLPFSRYRSLTKEISSLYKENPPNESESIKSDLQSVIGLNEKVTQIREIDKTGKSLFGSHWKGEDSNITDLREFSEWIVSYRKQILNDAITERSAEIISNGVKNEEIESLIKTINENVEHLSPKLEELRGIIKFDYKDIWQHELELLNLSELARNLQEWLSGIDKLLPWSQYILRRRSIENSVASPILEFIESDRINPDDLEQYFMSCLSNSLLDIAFKDRIALSTFIGDLHEGKIKSFSELDRELIEQNRIRVSNELYKIKPQVGGGASKGSEAGILLGEINRKRGHMPIRKLLLRCGSLIRKYKPCFMMSPLSIAQFLDPLSIKFDVIIFDEASQVKPQDALGSLLRGNQLVVMGDSKQLPPTSFFDLIVEQEYDEDEEEGPGLSDMESILGQCKRSFPSNLLKWHYRSKHESLIAVSNHEFYDNQLLFYPSPINDPDDLGIKHEYCANTIYDRGKSSVNREEAKIVARACFEHYRKYPGKSLGVGTFNIKQQNAIEEEIERLKKENQDIESYFDRNKVVEYCFVKNLETIQGDERDVIFISIGFGKDIHGNISLNWGAINQEGGHRRLNVLITRARERCIVFSNFRAADMRVNENSKFGLRAFKTYLAFAENRQLESIKPLGEETESPFEDSVYEFLKENGYEVDMQIGCAGFRVDLGIVDDDKPGTYLVGIECDGAKYHSSPVARDRDRLRQQILESKGWNIYRVWSTDWYRNRKNAETRLLEAVEKIKQNKSFGSLSSDHTEQKSNIPQDKPDIPNNFIPNPFQTTIAENDNSNSSEYQRNMYDDVNDYQQCMSLEIPIQGELHEQSIEYLSIAVTKVVEDEGPIHFDEIVRRIRILWGLGRAGRRINDALKEATRKAISNRQILDNNNFLWAPTMQTPRVRKRNDDPPPKIEFICEEEIIEALKLVIKNQHASTKEDLAIQASRLLGFQATRAETYSKIESIINKQLDDNKLVLKQNGMIDVNPIN